MSTDPSILDKAQVILLLAALHCKYKFLTDRLAAAEAGTITLGQVEPAATRAEGAGQAGRPGALLSRTFSP